MPLRTTLRAMTTKGERSGREGIGQTRLGVGWAGIARMRRVMGKPTSPRIFGEGSEAQLFLVWAEGCCH